MKKTKAREYLLKYYKGLLSIDEGLALIREYCLDFGEEYHKTNLETFIILIIQHPHLFSHCLNWAIEEYLVKFSFVKIIAPRDPNIIGVDRIITIY